MSTSPRRVLAAAAASGVVAALALSACGADSKDDSTSKGTKDGVSKVAVTMTSKGGGDVCELSSETAKAGPVTFTVTNKDATAITEIELLQDQRILGEKESLAPGLSPVSFTVTLGGGKYQVLCPNASKETQEFTVTGKAIKQTGDTQTLLQSGTKQYGVYVSTQVSGMIDAVEKLQAAVDAGDLEAAKKQYGVARPFYEHVESDVAGFILPGFKAGDNKGFLDYLIDMRASNLDPKVGWTGFHAVERDLFRAGKITPQTKKYAADLTKNVKLLETQSKKITYKPEDLANGAVGLLEEVQANKIKGEEESFSHIDLVDFAANVEGAQQAFAQLKPGLTKIDPTLTAQIAKSFDSVNAMLDTYKDPSAVGGYKPYTAELKRTDANKLSQAVQSLQDSLSRLAEKVATA